MSPRARLLVLAALGAGACSHLDRARYATSQPPPLPAGHASLSPDQVFLVLPDISPLTISSESTFRLALGYSRLLPDARWRTLGDVRTADRPLGPGEWKALDCGWRLRGFGEAAPECEDEDRGRDRTRGRAIVTALLADLRTRAARAGANAIDPVKCYVALAPGQGRAWCEGTAGVATPKVAATGDAAASDSLGVQPLPQRAQVEPAVVLRPSRFVVGGALPVGAYGDALAVGQVLSLRARPLEIDLDTSALERSRLDLVGVDLTYRHALSKQVDAYLGGGVLWAGHATGPGWYPNMGDVRAVAGMELRARQASGALPVPYLDLRVGYLVPIAHTAGREGDRLLSGPMVEAGVGLAWPERR